HLSPDLLPGGFLGVSVFFVLSGYLITSLLLREGQGTGRIGLRRFWGRRFRRLLPAALVGLAVAVAVAAVAGDAHQLRTLPGDVTAAALYMANWRFIAQGAPYGAHYLQPSVVQHYWSLAIEEQFYVVVALVAAVLARFARRRSTWAIVLGLMAAASMAATVALGPGDQTRIYFGTGTRAFELLAGALLAVVVDGRIGSGAHDPHPRRRAVVQLAGLAAAVALAAALVTVSLDTGAIYRGGLWVAAGLTVVLVVAARVPGPLGRALSWKPLTALGLVSYGVYLYHWPLFIWLSPEATGMDGARLAVVRLAATAVLAVGSYVLVEQPVRHRRWPVGGARSLVVATAVGAVVVLCSVMVGSGAQARAVVSTPDIALPTTSVPAGAPDAPASAAAVAVGPPHRVLFLGDSMLHDAFPAMQADLAAQRIDSSAIGGPGQSLMSSQGAWLNELADAVTAQDPDVVVLESCCGTEEPWIGPDGQREDSASFAYWDAWRQLAGQATERAGAHGARVVWVLPPPADGDKSLWYGAIRERMVNVAQVERAIVAADPRVGLIDWGVLAAPDGTYAASLPDTSGNAVEIRAADGVHFSPAGQALQARVTVEQLLSNWTRLGGRVSGPADRAHT
ncbi:MAG TPA: acyltransferase family protein, partial [Acidimicrobiales bacterium]